MFALFNYKTVRGQCFLSSTKPGAQQSTLLPIQLKMPIVRCLTTLLVVRATEEETPLICHLTLRVTSYVIILSVKRIYFSTSVYKLTDPS